YEVFILNFHDGGASLEHNADVVANALDAIHAVAPNNPIDIVGISMGGVIARYALARAESHGTPHHAGVFVSYDAPQQGAHANRSFQDAIKQAPSGNAAVAALQTGLSCMAAMELLDYCTYEQSGQIHRAFYSILDTLNGDGYPHQTRN